jgi:acyl carrier protein
MISEKFELPVESVTRDTNIIDDLGADSLDVVEILMTVEEQFGLAIPEEEFPNLRTVSDLCDYIENNA